MDKVAILMATYNGEAYLQEQIESILEQSCKKWTLFIRDDNSTDTTPLIIDKYQKRYNNIHIIKDTNNANSAEKNFIYLLNHVKNNYINEFEYFMFSDQDDYWLDSKINDTICLLKKRENNRVPILVHTDLEVVDANLNTSFNSYVRMRSLNPTEKRLNRLLVQNNITGCTMLWNKSLMEKIDFDLENVAMHDWWIGLIACLFGEVLFLEKTTIKYRQHGANVVGATKTNSLRFVFNRLIKTNRAKVTIKKSIAQAIALKSVYSKELTKNDLIILNEYISIRGKFKINRWLTIFKYGFFKQGIIQNIGQLIFI